MRFFFLLFTILLAPFAASAAAQTFYELAHSMKDIINSATVLLVVFAIVVYFFGIVKRLYKTGAGGTGGKELSAYLLWGVIIIFFMVTVAGLVNILQNTLFG